MDGWWIIGQMDGWIGVWMCDRKNEAYKDMVGTILEIGKPLYKKLK